MPKQIVLFLRIPEPIHPNIGQPLLSRNSSSYLTQISNSVMYAYFYFLIPTEEWKWRRYFIRIVPHIFENTYEISLQIYFSWKLVFIYTWWLEYPGALIINRFPGLTLQDMTPHFQKRGPGVWISKKHPSSLAI